MALPWALSPPRHCMNDVTRGRNMMRPPKTENFPESKGPAHYYPKPVEPHKYDKGVMPFRCPLPGQSEREVTLSDGKDVRKLLPAGPGSYEAPDLWARARSPGQQSPLSSPSRSPQRGGTSPPQSRGHGAPSSRLRSPPQGATRSDAGDTPSPRAPPLVGSRAKLVSSALRHSALPETIGPGSYDPPSSARGKGGVKFSTLKRDANNPIPRPPPLSPEEIRQLTPVGHGKPGTAEPGLRGSPRRPAGKVLEKRGPTISTTPRTFNLSNPNSFTFRHRDADFDIPPPGWYTARDEATRKRNGGAGAFSTSPRRIDLARRTAAPGPGTYHAGDGLSA